MDKTPNEFLNSVITNVARSKCVLLQLSIRAGIGLYGQRVGVIEMRRDYSEEDSTYIVGYVDHEGNVYGKYFSVAPDNSAFNYAARVTRMQTQQPPTNPYASQRKSAGDAAEEHF